VPASLAAVTQQLPAPSAETLAELAAVQPLKQQAFSSWSPGQTWFAWCSTTGSTVTMNDATWVNWNNSVTSTTGSLAFNYATNTAYVSTGTQWVTWNTAHQETEDQRAAREERTREVLERQRERRAEMEARAAGQRKEREQAEARSLELLRSLLTDAQWASYQDKGWFEVRGKSGRRWRVRNRGQSGNVDLMPEIGEERDATYCAHPPDGLPSADAHAAQMLALVTDDEAFMRIANRHWARHDLVELRGTG
jgi:hypothetical protein